MPTSPAKWLGARRLTLKPDGVTVDYTDRPTAALEYQGPYELCLAHRPARGATMPGFLGMTVDRTVVRKAGAPGFGELSVYLSSDTEDDTEEGGDPITEISWQEEERDLILLPLYNTGGAQALDDEARSALAVWMEESDNVQKAAFNYYKRNSDGTQGDLAALTTPARHFARKILRGTDSYLEFVPVASLTTFSRAKPSAIRTCGKRITGKPFAACPDGYVWLRVADDHNRSGRHGKWRRDQRFTGALVWDTDLYGAES